MLSRWFHMPVAASVFAGLLGAGVVDLVLVLARGTDVGLVAGAGIILGLYGALGLCAAFVAGCGAAAISAALPGGFRALGPDHELDRRVATGLLAGAVGALTAGALEAGSHALLIAGMHSRTLATLTAFGTTAIAVPIGVLVTLIVWRPLAAVVNVLPRPARLPRTALVAIALGAAALAAVVFAFSRADWRVLDLGPAQAGAIALVLGVGHGLVWHTSGRALRVMGLGAINTVRVLAPLVVVALLLSAVRLPEDAPVFEAIEDHSLGMRHVLALGRGLADHDGDGFASILGGGDCNDGDPETFPGAEEVPGDGIDQNCQGGDAAPVALDLAPAASAKPPETKRRKGAAFTGNIVIISIDSLRADRLGVAGYRRRRNKTLTPSLDALARSGAYFRRVWSHAPNTPRSFPALLTSRYPSEIAWAQRSLNYSPILPQNETFFEQLGRAGWKPIGIFSHFYFAAERALNQGFAEWSNDGAKSIADSNKDTAAPRIVPRVVARLKQAAAKKERFVLWTHLFEPHSSYMVHPGFRYQARGVEGLEEKYDYEIGFVDYWAGKIITALETTGLRKNTAVLVVADHGEAWGEHKHLFHGQDLTEEQLRVPFILSIPGRKPVVVDSEAALVDVGPTLLDLVGLQSPPSFRGRSLLPALAAGDDAAEPVLAKTELSGKGDKESDKTGDEAEGPADNVPEVAAAPSVLPPKPVFAELLPASAWPKHEVMMVLSGKKIVHKISERRWELYDLAADPKQKKDLAKEPSKRALFNELKAKVVAFEEGKR
jgi:arylsulfatase A-like enzyme